MLPRDAWLLYSAADVVITLLLSYFEIKMTMFLDDSTVFQWSQNHALSCGKLLLVAVFLLSWEGASGVGNPKWAEKSDNMARSEVNIELVNGGLSQCSVVQVEDTWILLRCVTRCAEKLASL